MANAQSSGTTIEVRAANTTAPKRRILFLSSCPEPWGGSEELWAGTAGRLSRAGHYVSACKTLVDRNHQRIHQLWRDGVAVLDYNDYRMSGITLRARRKSPHHVECVVHDKRDETQKYACMQQLQIRNYDLAVISQGENFDGLNFVDICKLIGVPYVLICHKASEFRWPDDSIRGVMRAAYTEALRTYFVAEHNRELTELQIGQTLTNAEVVRNPYFTEAPEALPWLDATDGVFRLACIGRLYTLDKGQDMLLRVLARSHWRQRRLEVNLYGQGSNRESLEQIRRLLCLPNVRFCGFSGSVLDVWKLHHALILPSRAEGLPLVLVEAMLCGRPGIVTNAGGNAEVIEDGVTGFVAYGIGEDPLDAVMERAWKRRHEWEAIGKKAAGRIRELIPPDPCGLFAAKLERVVNDLISGPLS